MPINSIKCVSKKISTSIPSQEDNTTEKDEEMKDINEKIVQLFYKLQQQSSNDIFYLLSKEKFVHYIHHTFPVDWLETFSPPPDVA